MNVVIIDYGAGNTRSVQLALQRIGVEAQLTADAAAIASADKVIFPGVGHARAAMDVLRDRNLDTLIRSLRQPVLGICLGMQLLCEYSEEGNTQCLRIFSEQVKRFPPPGKVPHMGWNTTHATNGFTLFPEAWYYFVHSYYVPAGPHTVLGCEYILPFAAAIQKDNFYGVQFHPEKSGKAGELLLENFIKL